MEKLCKFRGNPLPALTTSCGSTCLGDKIIKSPDLVILHKLLNHLIGNTLTFTDDFRSSGLIRVIHMILLEIIIYRGS